MTALVCTPSAAPGLTEALASRVVSQEFAAIPADVVIVAKQCLMDWLGVAIGARHTDLVQILAADAAEDGGMPVATLIGRKARASTLQAALINGAMGHALDFDDVIFMGHPSAPVAPAAFAVTEVTGASGRDLLDAFIAGFETECRVSRFMGPSHYAKGWHGTATYGTFGAAAAAGRLLKLTVDQQRHAFGLAATQAAGLKSMFGTMTKPFHAGHAAQAGIHAARLAARGFTANSNALECEQGFGDTQSTDADAARGLAEDGWFVPDTLFKYHAACYLTHSSIEAARALRDAAGFSVGAIRSVELGVDPGHLRVCNIQAPRTGLECKFSLRMTAALALSGEDTASEATYSEATAARGDLNRLREKVTVTPSGKGTRAMVRIVFADGRTTEQAADVGIPMRDLAAQQEKLEAKFLTLVTPEFGAERADALRSILTRLDRVAQITELTEAIA